MLKRLCTILLISLFTISSFGCAAKDMERQYFDSVNKSNTARMSMAAEYLKSRNQMNSDVMKSFSGSSEGTLAMVLYSMMSQKQDAEFLAMVAPTEAKKFTSNADLTATFIENVVPKALTLGAGIWLGDKLIDGLTGNGISNYTLGAGSSFSQVNGEGNTLQLQGDSFDLEIPTIDTLE